MQDSIVFGKPEEIATIHGDLPEFASARQPVDGGSDGRRGRAQGAGHVVFGCRSPLHEGQDPGFEHVGIFHPACGVALDRPHRFRRLEGGSYPRHALFSRLFDPVFRTRPIEGVDLDPVGTDPACGIGNAFQFLAAIVQTGHHEYFQPQLVFVHVAKGFKPFEHAVGEKAGVGPIDAIEDLGGGGIEIGDDTIGRTHFLTKLRLPEQRTVGENRHEVLGMERLEPMDDAADVGMEGRLPGSGEGDAVEIRCRFKHMGKFGEDGVGRHPFLPLDGALGGSPAFAIDAIEAAGLGRNEIHAKGKPESARRHRPKNVLQAIGFFIIHSASCFVDGLDF